MPIDPQQALGTPEGQKVLEELWPDIVNTYFKALSNPAPAK
jgi:hypothetical protein